MFWAFEKGIFQFFANIWVKLKSFSGKLGQIVKVYWNQKFVKKTFLENVFGATLRSKTNVLSVWKNHIPVFCKFLGDEVELIIWESETKY